MHFFIQILFLLIYMFHVTLVSSLQCISYNVDYNNSQTEEYSIAVEEPSSNDSYKVVDCHNESDGCFVVWVDYRNGTTSIKQKGCFTISGSDCDSRERCIEKGHDRQGFLFCCCRRNLCNANFSWEPTPTMPSSTEATRIDNDDIISFYLVYVVFPISMALLLFIMYLLKKRKFHYFNQIPNIDQQPQSSPPTPRSEKLRPIKLEEIVARGKYGAVWKATDKNEIVAVKIMPKEEKQSWLTEQEVFKLPFMNHDNILRLIAAEKRGEGLRPEFWLITPFYPLGSMMDFLKANTINWEQFCYICYTMARGLSHLHEEISPERGDDSKPIIAHRDFKSSNVLLKNDLSACIADFGLALIFRKNRTCGDTQSQVGTRRYMAPEVLEGAINFSRDSFIRIDMYAFGLVLWELASRCSSFYQGPVPDYKLPFETEVGPHPTLEDMQEIVVQQKRRPIIKESWYQHPGFVSLCPTIEECWDHDSEARVSASCVMERFLEHVKFLDSPNTPLLYDNVTCNTVNGINPEIVNSFIAV